MEEKNRYDCIECGQQNCVTVIQNTGFCNTDGCIMNSPIQFIYYPNWKEPKTSRAEREIWWAPIHYEQSTLPKTKLPGDPSLINKKLVHENRPFTGSK